MMRRNAKHRGKSTTNPTSSKPVVRMGGGLDPTGGRFDGLVSSVAVRKNALELKMLESTLTTLRNREKKALRELEAEMKRYRNDLDAMTSTGVTSRDVEALVAPMVQDEVILRRVGKKCSKLKVKINTGKNDSVLSKGAKGQVESEAVVDFKKPNPEQPIKETTKISPQETTKSTTPTMKKPLTPEPSTTEMDEPQCTVQRPIEHVEKSATPLTDSIARTCGEYFALLKLVGEHAQQNKQPIQTEPTPVDAAIPNVTVASGLPNHSTMQTNVAENNQGFGGAYYAPNTAYYAPNIVPRQQTTVATLNNQHSQYTTKTIRLQDNSTQFESRFIPDDVEVTSVPRVVLPSWWLRNNKPNQTERMCLPHTAEVAVNTAPMEIIQPEVKNVVTAVAKVAKDKESRRKKSRDSKKHCKRKELPRTKFNRSPVITPPITSSTESSNDYATSSSSDHQTFITENKRKSRSRCVNCLQNSFDKLSVRWRDNQIPFYGPVVTSSMGRDVSVQYPSNLNLLSPPMKHKYESCPDKPATSQVAVQATVDDDLVKIDKATSFNPVVDVVPKETATSAAQQPLERLETTVNNDKEIQAILPGNTDIKETVMAPNQKKNNSVVLNNEVDETTELQEPATSSEKVLENIPVPRVYKIELYDIQENSIKNFPLHRDPRPISSRRVQRIPSMTYERVKPGSNETTTTSNSCDFTENCSGRKAAPMGRVESDMLADNVFHREKGRSTGIRLNQQRRFYIPAQLIEEREHTPNIQTFHTPCTGKSAAPSLMLGTEMSDFVQSNSGLSGSFISRWRRGVKSGGRQEMTSELPRELRNLECTEEINFSINNSHSHGFWNRMEGRKQSFDCDITISRNNNRPGTANMTSQINLPKIRLSDSPNRNRNDLTNSPNRNRIEYNYTREATPHKEVVNQITQRVSSARLTPRNLDVITNELPAVPDVKLKDTTAPRAGVREIKFPKKSCFLKRVSKPEEQWSYLNATEDSMEHLAPSSSGRAFFSDITKFRLQCDKPNGVDQDKLSNEATKKAEQPFYIKNNNMSSLCLNNEKRCNRPRLVAKRKH